MRFSPGCSCCGADCEGCCTADPPDGPPDTLFLTVTPVGGASCSCVADYTLVENSVGPTGRSWAFAPGTGCVGANTFNVTFTCNCVGDTVTYDFVLSFNGPSFGVCTYSLSRAFDPATDTCSPFYVDLGELSDSSFVGNCSSLECGGGGTTFRFEVSE